MKRLLQASALAFVACSLTHSIGLAQSRPAHKGAPSASSKLPTELALQLQLRDNPHDVQAHEQLNKLLSAKYAFRSRWRRMASGCGTIQMITWPRLRCDPSQIPRCQIPSTPLE